MSVLCFIVKESRAYVNDICNSLSTLYTTYYIIFTITDHRYSLQHGYSLVMIIEELSSEASIMLENM